MMTSKKKALCEFADLTELSSKSFSVKINRKTIDIFVIRKLDQVYAYQNICPHAQAHLEWNPDEFLDEKKETIICALHGATFSIEEGECLGGPCNGNNLTKAHVFVVDGKVVLKY